jgi:RNA-directed DNA polymerase
MRSESESSSSANVTERRTEWDAVNWRKANRIVRNLRRRIFRASAEAKHEDTGIVEVSDLLEPCALSGASAVLRRRRVSDDPLLSDNVENCLPKTAKSGIVVDRIHHVRKSL